MTPSPGAPATPEKNRRGATRWSVLIGAIIGVVGAVFVVKALFDNRAEVADAAANARPLLILLALALAALGMTGIGLAWRSALRILGTDLSLLSALRGYFVGQLGKYVPGGVWAIMGRGEWARSEGVPPTLAYSSVLLSMGSAYLAAVVLVAVLIPLSGLLTANAGAQYLLIFLLLPIGFLAIHPKVVNSSLAIVRRMTGRELALKVPTWGDSAWVVARQVPSWILIGFANLSLAVAFGASGDVVNVVSATAVAWVVGFLALPVPGGIGVREAVFVALATSLPTGVAATVAIAARIVFITVDAVGASLTTVLLARRKVTSR